MAQHVTVVGSVNVDLVARCERLPRPGETVTDAVFERIPGGKGANQAVASARLGGRGETRLVAAVGDDAFGGEALAALEAANVATDRIKRVVGPTGVALILVDRHGENQIVVAPGANAQLGPEDVEIHPADIVMCQLEIPMETVAAAFAGSSEFRCLNAAPARPVPAEILKRAHLVVVNRLEREAIGDVPGYLAVTLGSEGAILYRRGREVARARPPEVTPVDGTAAGDAFCAALADGLAGQLNETLALRRACAAGAIAASRFGAQPSLPTADEIDAILAAA